MAESEERAGGSEVDADDRSRQHQLRESLKRFWNRRTYRRRTRKMLGWAREESDPKHQREIAVPDGEEVLLHGVWSAEAYGPSEIPNLIAGLREKGFDEIRGGFDSAPSWIPKDRRSAFTRRWGALPMVVPPDWRGFSGNSISIELPEEFYVAQGHVISVTPSLTILVFGFMLTDGGALAIQRALQAEHRSEERRTGRWRSISGPEASQKAAVQRARRRLRESAATWLTSIAPGAFHLSGATLPAGELLTSALADPFASPAREKGKVRSYLDALELSTWDLWRGTMNREFQMKEGSEDYGDPHTLRFGGKASALLPDEETARIESAGSPRWLFFQQSERNIHWFVALWTIHAYLESGYRIFSEVRDEPQLRSARFRVAFGQIRKSQQRIRNSSDRQATIAELLEDGFDWRNSWDGSDFEFDKGNLDQRADRPVWTKSIAGRVKRQATVLRDAERRISERLSAEGTVLAAAANLRLQRSVLWLSIIAALIAGAALAVAIVGLNDDGEETPERSGGASSRPARAIPESSSKSTPDLGAVSWKAPAGEVGGQPLAAA